MRTPSLQALGAVNRMKTTPIPVQRTNRPSMHRVLTSMNAGKMVPIAAIPLLREDQLKSGRFALSFEMAETVEVLMNSINVRVMAYLVPKLAFERYDGMDAINKSYEGLPSHDGGPVIPWFEPMLGGGVLSNDVLYSMGLHWKEGQNHNSDINEAYNVIWNFRAKNRSPDITLRARLDKTLAPAFWLHQTFAHIVPDFDQAIIDGQVALNVVDGTVTATAPIKFAGGALEGKHLNLRTELNEDYVNMGRSDTAGGTVTGIGPGATSWYGVKAELSDVLTELVESGVTVSLSNIELARKTQAFANLRRQYNGHSDEYIIDLLMDGITIPEQQWKQPILLFDQTTQFGMSKRYASDSGNLTESVVNGMTAMEMRLSTPRVPCGGVVMIVAEVTPEQMFERQKSPYLHALDVDDLPQFLRDTLDPEKVQIVRNDEIDLDHDTPSATFGYGPLNHQWMRNIPAIGGRFFRPLVDDVFDEDRQRLWAVETQNPILSKDFYLCTTMHYKPFVITDDEVHHFDCLMRGEAFIGGNTVFGGALVEATDDYDKVAAVAPTDRIEKP